MATGIPFINQVVNGTWETLLPALSSDSIDMAFMSPPFANQRKDGIDPLYPEYLRDFMTTLWPYFKKGASVLLDLNLFCRRCGMESLRVPLHTRCTRQDTLDNALQAVRPVQARWTWNWLTPPTS